MRTDYTALRHCSVPLCGLALSGRSLLITAQETSNAPAAVVWDALGCTVMPSSGPELHKQQACLYNQSSSHDYRNTRLARALSPSAIRRSWSYVYCKCTRWFTRKPSSPVCFTLCGLNFSAFTNVCFSFCCFFGQSVSKSTEKVMVILLLHVNKTIRIFSASAKQIMFW